MEQKAKEQFLGAYDAYADALFRYAYLHTLDADSARFLVQDAFIKGWVYIARGGAVQNLQAFLYTITHVLAREAVRSERTVQNDGDRAKSILRAEAPSSGKHSYAPPFVGECFRTLTEAHRVVLALSFVNGVPLQRARRLIGLSEKDALRCLHDAYAAIGECVRETGGCDMAHFLDNARRIRLHPAEHAAFRGRLLTLLTRTPDNAHARRDSFLWRLRSVLGV